MGSQVEMPSVLVVDDEPQILDALSRTLSPQYQITTAATAQQALEHMDEGAHYAAVICDLSMPEMSGIELLRQIRERDPGVPVIVLTGQGSLQSAMEVMEHGGFRYLTKPFEEEILIKNVQAATATRHIDDLRRRAVEICDSGVWTFSKNNELDPYFDEAISNIYLAFQPIVDCKSQEVFGYEALVRSNGPKLTNPGLLFGAAERLGRVRDIGREVRRLAARKFKEAPPGSTLFVNLHAVELGDEELYAPSAPLSAIADQVVLEITERTSLGSVEDLSGRMQSLRELGFRIAVDDLGAGYAGLTSFSELMPDIVKLDMSLIRGMDSSPRQQSIVKSMLTVCLRDLDTRVVCEGVETPQEAESLDSLGADLLQGYLFGRPEPHFQLRGDAGVGR